MRRNETKFLILAALENLDEPSPWELVNTWLELERNVELSPPATKMALLRAYKQGLAHRRQGRYSLSERGRERLQWLRQNPP